MPTNKKRINLTLENSLYNQLEQLRRIKKSPFLSSVIIDLTKQALELQEDLYFAKIAKEREREPLLSHKKVWAKK